jgi:hypothetical protein
MAAALLHVAVLPALMRVHQLCMISGNTNSANSAKIPDSRSAYFNAFSGTYVWH